MKDFRNLLGQTDKGPVPGSAHMDPSGALVVNCRGCGQFPDTGSPACVRCMTAAVASEGVADRIKLEAGKDTEVSGPPAELLCDLAQVRRSVPPSGGGRKCQSCMRSPERLMADAWADFPDPSFLQACDRLYGMSADGPECAACLQRTHSALKMAEDNMERVRAKAARLASGKEAVR